MDTETSDSTWEAVFETADGNLFSLPFDTFRVPQDGTLRMRNADGELHSTHFVEVKEGDKVTYHPTSYRRPVEDGYLDGVWPALPRGEQKYVTIYLLVPGYRMVFIVGHTITPVTYEA